MSGIEEKSRNAKASSPQASLDWERRIFLRGGGAEKNYELFLPLVFSIKKHWNSKEFAKQKLTTKKFSYSQKMAYNKEYAYW